MIGNIFIPNFLHFLREFKKAYIVTLHYVTLMECGIIENEIEQLTAKAKSFSNNIDALDKEIKKIIVGQEEIIEKLIISMIIQGHVLLEGVPPGNTQFHVTIPPVERSVKSTISPSFMFVGFPENSATGGAWTII